MFASYTSTSPCEFLLVNESEFNRILADQALEEFRNRLQTIIASRIFVNWKPEDIIRLARMGFVRTFKRGEVILQQGKKSSHLYIIMKGDLYLHSS